MQRAAAHAQRLAQATSNVETSKLLGPDGLLGGA